MHFYNDTEPFVCSWLEQLTKNNHLPHGTIDQRPIQQLTAADLAPYTQCHFFAGIGGWPHALKLAGWPDDMPVWTGSCPCQPFSCAGQGRGTDDERHLWPEFRRLIAECRPPVVFGEQVASKAGRLWLDGVRTDLEKLGYAVGASDLCAAGVGAPHIRQRLYWMAYTQRDRGHNGRGPLRAGNGSVTGREAQEWGADMREVEGHSAAGRLANHECEGSQRRLQRRENPQQQAANGHAGCDSSTGGVDNPKTTGPSPKPQGNVCRQLPHGSWEPSTLNFWSAFDILPCLDTWPDGTHKARRIEPGTFPLAHGVPARVGRLRGYGNAIVPPLAAEFIQAAVEAIQLATT